ncbi:hypothetical protein VP01_436g1 [Puccinia sorghi]|uniref:Uncharacterized protein n=1 Tax=Puccinia sorghi TaxID=27349 RepID=A0A0L6UPR8_9BASI|nr:hypothetical protein VP01_436g1 [Puccinia sorghi]
MDSITHQQVQFPTILLLLLNSWKITYTCQHHLKPSNLKNSSSSFETTDDKVTSQCYQFLTHTNADKKKSCQKTRSSACKAHNSTQSLTQQGNTPSKIEKNTSQDLKSGMIPIRSYNPSHHNFQPLIFFFSFGACGLLVVSRNHCHASLSDCMSCNSFE